MASVLNSTFSSVFTKENMTSIPAPKKIFQGPEEHKLALTEIDISEVRAYLQKIDPNKSPGLDNLSPRVLRECSQQLELPITLIFNKSLAQVSVPLELKKANITPIFKKGDKKTSQ